MFRYLFTFLLVTNTVFGLSYYIQNKWVRSGPTERSMRIHKGQDLAEGDYPFVIVIAGITPAKDVYRVATGAIITEDWAITAAHVFSHTGVHGNNTLVVWYDKFTESPLVTKMYSEIKEIVPHPGFRDMPFLHFEYFYGVNDICLLKVAKVRLPAYGTLSPVDHGTLIGLATTYFGAGETEKQGNDIFRPIQVGHGMIIKCGQPVSSWSPFLLCVTPPCSDRQHMPGIGDSGGPFVIDGKIIGTFSVRYFSYTASSWTAFNPVDLYIDWIHDVTHRKR